MKEDVENSRVVIVSTSEETTNSRVTLEEVLENKLPPPLDLSSFRRYCEKLSCEENLDFLIDVNTLLASDDLESSRKLYKDLYVKYIESESEFHVNLSSRDFEQLGVLYQQIDSAEMHDLANALTAAKKSIMFLLRNDTLNHYLMRIVLDKQISLAQDIALWWRNGSITLKQFFTFPNPVNKLESRLHAICNLILILINCCLLWFLDIKWLGIPIAYGFLARVLAGPRVDPQAFFVLFVLRPLVEDVLFLAESSFTNGFPRRVAQFIGLAFSSSALLLQVFGFPKIALLVWGILLFFTAIQAFVNVCVVCVMFAFAEKAGFLKCSDIEIQYVSKNKGSSRSLRSRQNSDAGRSTTPKPSKSPKSTTMQSATFGMSDSKSKLNATLP